MVKNHCDVALLCPITIPPEKLFRLIKNQQKKGINGAKRQA